MRRLAEFDRLDYDRGRNTFWQGLWHVTSFLLFQPFWFPNRLRPPMLRLFGAELGSNIFIRHDVRIMWPWKLKVGDNCWLGEGLRIINLEQVTLGNDVCLSQQVMICTGSHDHRQASFPYRNKPVAIYDGAWIAARATVLPGVHVGRCAVVASGEVVRDHIPDLKMQIAGQLKDIREPL